MPQHLPGLKLKALRFAISIGQIHLIIVPIRLHRHIDPETAIADYCDHVDWLSPLTNEVTFLKRADFEYLEQVLQIGLGASLCQGRAVLEQDIEHAVHLSRLDLAYQFCHFLGNLTSKF